MSDLVIHQLPTTCSPHSPPPVHRLRREPALLPSAVEEFLRHDGPGIRGPATLPVTFTPTALPARQ
ncbi:hypothetical protein [Streptomyces sp. NPDC029004]|uniref:hypothetical protein n=1 Tax=Streptomyces sp. NPDC029004 TaxID=3154490 RepID=UPI0033DD389D